MGRYLFRLPDVGEGVTEGDALALDALRREGVVVSDARDGLREAPFGLQEQHVQ